MMTAPDGPSGDEVEMTDALPRSNPVGPPKLRIGPKDDPGRIRAGNPEDVCETVQQLSSIEAGAETPIPSEQGACFCNPEARGNAIASNQEFREELEKKLDEERGRRQRAENELGSMMTSLRKAENELAATEIRLQKEGKELLAKKTELEDIRKRWKQTARELNKMQAQSQGFYQVTDNYLIDLITRLRYNIRNLSIQYFSELPYHKVRLAKDADFYKRYLTATTSRPWDLYYLEYSEGRPSVIQAFLWRVLVDRLFHRVRWADAEVWELCRVLEPNGLDDPSPKNPVLPETAKKFQVWKASTIGLVLSSTDKNPDSKANRYLRGWKNSFLEQVNDAIGPLVLRNEDFQQEFLKIIDEAIELDKEISRQVAYIQWIFPEGDGALGFDPSMMELKKGEKQSGKAQEVFVVTAPAVGKRGKSNGEAFHEISTMLRMEVSCKDPLA